MTPQDASAVMNFLVPQLHDELKTTRRVLAAVPEDRADYTPDPKSMKARELTRHIAFVEIWFLESVLKGEFTEPDDKAMPDSIAGVLEAYDAQVPALLRKLKEISPEQAAQPVTFYSWTLPRVAYLQFLQKHTIHHRGQLSAYLRPMGAKVPSIYGGSADEPMTTEAGA